LILSMGLVGGGSGRHDPEAAAGLDSDPRRWIALALLGASQLMGMSLWFTASAVGPELQQALSLSPGQAGALLSAVQWGFVAGTAFAALLNLADVIPGRFYFAASALLGASANGALLLAGGFPSALLTRFATGFFLAGVYPPAMKMIATWFRSGRGLAIGTVVGALTLGKATPYLVKALPSSELSVVVLGASAAAGLAGVLVLIGYREGPFPFRRAPFRWDQVGRIWRDRPTRLAIDGYLGHMWELYAMWAAMSPFLLVRLGDPAAAAWGAFLAIGAGAPGCILAGRWADRWGRERVASLAMVLSGSTALVAGWIPASGGILLGICIFWGFWVVADSAQFSALVTEVAPEDAVGTALTLQTGLGFALTGVLIPVTLQIGEGAGWGWAFAFLALGPVFGVRAMGRLRAIRRLGQAS
jgi:MFS family permease